MPQVTDYVAIPPHLMEDGEIFAGEPRECRYGGSAARWAATMAADPQNYGAIAISRSGDTALGDFDDAVVLQSIGEVDGAAL